MFGLELRIGSLRGLVTEATYRALLDDVHGVLREVDNQRIYGGRGAWGLRHVVADRGLTIRFEPFVAVVEPGHVETLVRNVVSGVHGLAEAAAIPTPYTDTAVDLIGKAAGRRGSNGVDTIVLAAMNGTTLDAADITDVVAQNAVESLRPARTDLGSVEGVIDALAGAAAGRRRAVLVEDHTGRRVRLHFGNEHMKFFNASWGSRVAAHGLITYNRVGQPIRLNVDDVRALPTPGPVSDLARLVGIAPNWTGGRSVMETMHELRRRA